MAENTYTQAPSGVRLEEAVIGTGQSQSFTIEFLGRAVKRILTPGTLLGAKLRFYHAVAPATTFYLTADTEGTVIAIPFTAGQAVELNPSLFAGTLAMKVETVQSDGTTPVTQAADQTLKVIGVAL